ncbi:MAG: hypothetical protein WB998_05795, partial [Solirubrobacteraceae bacterium]
LSGATFTDERVRRELEALIVRAVDELEAPASRVGVRCELRYAGQSFELTVAEDISVDEQGGSLFVPSGARAVPERSRVPFDSRRLRVSFEDAHEARYGYRDEGAEVELVNIRVSAVGARPALRLDGATRERPAPTSTPIVFDGKLVEAELWRGELPRGTRVRGPALCAMPESTLLVPPGWRGVVDERGTVVLEQVG